MQCRCLYYYYLVGGNTGTFSIASLITLSTVNGSPNIALQCGVSIGRSGEYWVHIHAEWLRRDATPTHMDDVSVESGDRAIY